MISVKQRRGYFRFRDKVPYHIWIKRAKSTELSAIYDPSDPEMVIEVEKDSITYIIYYK